MHDCMCVRMYVCICVCMHAFMCVKISKPTQKVIYLHNYVATIVVVSFVKTVVHRLARRRKVCSVERAGSLTRFNKIAIQGTPQMAVDKEAISFSRVY